MSNALNQPSTSDASEFLRGASLVLKMNEALAILTENLGRELAEAGVELHELCSWPSCDLRQLPEVTAAIRALPEAAISALYTALLTDHVHGKPIM